MCWDNIEALPPPKGNKERNVPLPKAMRAELRAFWRTHRHPRWIFPCVGRGWREQPEQLAQLGSAVEPMSVGSVQHCLRLARAEAKLPQGTLCIRCGIVA